MKDVNSLNVKVASRVGRRPKVALRAPPVLDWTKSNEDFYDQYARAREKGYQCMADERGRAGAPRLPPACVVSGEGSGEAGRDRQAGRLPGGEPIAIKGKTMAATPTGRALHFQ